MKQSRQRFLWFRLAVALGTALGLLLLVQSIITYYQASNALVTAELQRDARWRVTELEREITRREIQDPAEISRLVSDVREEEPRKIAWITVLDLTGQIQFQSGTPVGPHFSATQLQLANQRGAPVSSIRDTPSGKVLVTAFAVRFTPRPVGERGEPQQNRSTPRFGRRFVELALYWDSASESFAQLRSDLIISCLAAGGLVGAMVLLWSRFPKYLQGTQLRQQTELARQVQSALLPPKDFKVQGLDFAGELVSAWQVGGDFYDVFSEDSGRVAMVVGDVSGDGLPAAMMAGVVHGAVRASRWLEGSQEHEAACHNLNELLRGRTAPDEFVTLFWCYYEPREHVLKYLNAGHPPPLLLRKNPNKGTSVCRLEEGGPVLGVLSTATYRQSSIPICPGDLLVLYSDGITEAENAAEEQFGEERLLQLISDVSQRSAEQIRDEILRRVRAFVGQDEFRDDLTLLVARFHFE